MQTILYFCSILLTCALTGWLAFYAWQHPSVPGARIYSVLAFSECLLALAEIFSMISSTQEQALFWFNIRVFFIAVIPVLWLIFSLEYQDKKEWISKRLAAIAFIIPILTQVILWSNNLHDLWVKQEVVFHPNGPFWLVETSSRIPGIWFLIHSFYSLLLLAAGIVIILISTWGKQRLYRRQAILLSSGALITLVTTIIPIFNLFPQNEFNPFIPGIGVSALLFALAIFRFQFLRHSPATEISPRVISFDAQEKRSLSRFLFFFIMMAAGITAFGYLSYQNYEVQFRSQVESQLSAIADLKVTELTNWRAERLGNAEVIRKNTSFTTLVQNYLQNPEDSQVNEQLKTWLESLRSSYRYDRVFLMDTKNIIRISSPPTPEPASTYLVQATARVLSSGQISFLDFHRDSNDSPIYLSILVPIIAGQENLSLGILVLQVNPLDYLYPFIQQWPVPSSSAETLLVRQDGDSVLFLNSLRFQPDAALNLRIPLSNTDILAVKAVLGQTGAVEGADYRNNQVVGALRSIPDSPWFLVARMDTDEVYAPLRDRFWQTIVFFGLLLLATGTGLTLAWRQQQMRFYRSRYQSAEALRASEQKFRDTIFYLDEGYYSVSLEGVLLEHNQAFNRILNFPESQDLKGKNLPDFWQNPVDRQEYLNALIANGSISNFPINAKTQDGKNIIILAYAHTVKDENNHPLRIEGIFLDITERKRQEEQIFAAQVEMQQLLVQAEQSRRALLSVVEDQKRAEEKIRELNMGLEQRVAERTAQLEVSNKELEAFSYSVSHDLRAPLRAIDGFSRILEQDYAQNLDEEGLRLLGVIRKNTNKLDHLITDLLALSRVSRSELNYTEIDMTILVNSIFQEVAAPEVLEKFTFKSTELPFANGDTTLISQVWMNLISNAIKYTMPKEERIIQIKGWKKDGVCTYSIQDSGVGFNPQYTDKLFGLFQRLHKSGDFEGTGVGLAIVQRIVQRHGGRVWGEGVVGEGATFCFTLPERQANYA